MARGGVAYGPKLTILALTSYSFDRKTAGGPMPAVLEQKEGGEDVQDCKAFPAASYRSGRVPSSASNIRATIPECARAGVGRTGRSQGLTIWTGRQPVC